MFVETGARAYNLNNMLHAEWDEVEMWIDMHFLAYGHVQVTGQDAIFLIDAIKGRAQIDEYHQRSNLRAIKFSEEIDQTIEDN